MDRVIKVIPFAIFLFGFVGSSVIPVDKCKLEDSACLKEAFQQALPVFAAGIPDVGIEVLDPLHMDDLSFDLSGLQFSLKEGQLKGLKTAEFDKIKWDLKKKRIEVDYHLNCSVRGHYTAGGRLLILPINGDGQLKLKLRNVAIAMFIDYKMEKGADGKEYVKPTKYEFAFDVKDNAHFSLTGLFNGNKELSDTMLSFLNENWKQVSIEFGRPMIDGAARKIYKNVVIFFSKMPLAEIANV
ncbi:circadian clock-controlled protein daywake-like [Pectinophora gossypiella]|uniref:circadian clock-controlled protein daywake-like n=1 Tax=Pectinophora gossypiella TaxID=13191 RepID=UPI00214E821B|nr:circadian clock-controlled protein daywake-like [Pectinophora gossypiella]